MYDSPTPRIMAPRALILPPEPLPPPLTTLGADLMSLLAEFYAPEPARITAPPIRILPPEPPIPPPLATLGADLMSMLAMFYAPEAARVVPSPVRFLPTSVDVVQPGVAALLTRAVAAGM